MADSIIKVDATKLDKINVVTLSETLAALGSTTLTYTHDLGKFIAVDAYFTTTTSDNIYPAHGNGSFNTSADSDYVLSYIDIGQTTINVYLINYNSTDSRTITTYLIINADVSGF